MGKPLRHDTDPVNDIAKGRLLRPPLRQTLTKIYITLRVCLVSEILINVAPKAMPPIRGLSSPCTQADLDILGYFLSLRRVRHSVNRCVST